MYEQSANFYCAWSYCTEAFSSAKYLETEDNFVIMFC